MDHAEHGDVSPARKRGQFKMNYSVWLTDPYVLQEATQDIIEWSQNSRGRMINSRCTILYEAQNVRFEKSYKLTICEEAIRAKHCAVPPSRFMDAGLLTRSHCELRVKLDADNLEMLPFGNNGRQNATTFFCLRRKLRG